MDMDERTSSPSECVQAIHKHMHTNDIEAALKALYCALRMPRATYTNTHTHTHTDRLPAPTHTHPPLACVQACAFAAVFSRTHTHTHTHTHTPTHTLLCNTPAAAKAVHKATECLIHTEFAHELIPTLTSATHTLQEWPNQLTPAHTELLKVCIKTKMYHMAVDTLKKKIYSINSMCELQDILAYFYYGGMVYTALKDFTHAFSFFRVAIAVAPGANSLIQFDSMKKYVLISALLGRSFKECIAKLSLTGHKVDSTIFCRRCHVDYRPFVDAVYERKVKEAQQILDGEKKQMFMYDGNLGLMKQCIRAIPYLVISDLSAKFSVMSFEDICKYARIDTPTLYQILWNTTIREHPNLNIRVDMAKEIVYLCLPKESSDTEILAQLQADIKAIMELSNSLSIKRKHETLPQPSSQTQTVCSHPVKSVAWPTQRL